MSTRPIRVFAGLLCLCAAEPAPVFAASLPLGGESHVTTRIKVRESSVYLYPHQAEYPPAWTYGRPGSEIAQCKCYLPCVSHKKRHSKIEIYESPTFEERFFPALRGGKENSFATPLTETPGSPAKGSQEGAPQHVGCCEQSNLPRLMCLGPLVDTIRDKAGNPTSEKDLRYRTREEGVLKSNSMTVAGWLRRHLAGSSTFYCPGNIADLISMYVFPILSFVDRECKSRPQLGGSDIQDKFVTYLLQELTKTPPPGPPEGEINPFAISHIYPPLKVPYQCVDVKPKGALDPLFWGHLAREVYKDEELTSRDDRTSKVKLRDAAKRSLRGAQAPAAAQFIYFLPRDADKQYSLLLEGLQKAPPIKVDEISASCIASMADEREQGQLYFAVASGDEKAAPLDATDWLAMRCEAFPDRRAAEEEHLLVTFTWAASADKFTKKAPAAPPGGEKGQAKLLQAEAAQLAFYAKCRHALSVLNEDLLHTLEEARPRLAPDMKQLCLQGQMG